MPSAISSPSEPEEIASISMVLSFLPSFMIEPLPNWRSIWLSAADRAFDLSMEFPSTTRKAGWAISTLLMEGFDPPTYGRSAGGGRNRAWEDCTPFVLRSQYVLFGGVGTGLFR